MKTTMWNADLGNGMYKNQYYMQIIQILMPAVWARITL